MSKEITSAEEKKIIVSVQKELSNAGSIEIVTVKNATDLEDAKLVLAKIKSARDGYKARIEDEIISPIKKSLKSLQDFWKPFTSKLDEVEYGQKSEISKYVTAEEIKKQKALAEQAAKVQEQLAQGKTAEKAIEKLQTIEEKKPEVKTRKDKKVRVTNEELIPEKYWIVDMVAVRRDALAGVDISGVEVYEEVTVING